MKCEEIKINLEEYIKGETDAKISAEIEKHLTGCSECRSTYEEMNEVIEDVDAVYQDIEMDEIFSDVSKLLQRRNYRRRQFVLKTALIASVFLIIFSISFSPILGKVIERIPLIAKYFSFDEGVNHALEEGFGQKVDVSDKSKGVLLTVHSIVADDNRTVILFSIGLDEDYSFDKGSLDGFFIEDQAGRELEVESYSYRYIRDENIFTGSIQTNALFDDVEKLSVGFRHVLLLDRRSLALPLAYTDQRVEIGIEGLDEFIIEKIDKLEDVLKIRYIVGYKDYEDDYMDPVIVVYNDGEKLNEGRITSLMKSSPGNEIDASFYMGEAVIDELDAVVEYNVLKKDISSGWNVSFKVDPAAAEDSTVQINIGKEIIMNGTKVLADRIVVTPSETRLYITAGIEKPSRLATWNITDIKLISSGMEYGTKTMIREKDETGTELVYIFDPVYDKLDDIVLAVNREYLTVDTEGKLVLENISEGKSSTVLQLDGSMIYVTYFREGSDTRIIFEADDIDIVSFEGLFLETGTYGSMSISNAIKARGGSSIEVKVIDFSQDSMVLGFDSYVVSRQAFDKIRLIP